MKDYKTAVLRGMRVAIPVGLGYFASAIALGILAVRAGVPPLAATLASLLLNASAGEYAFFTGIAGGVGAIEIAAMQLIANIRYLLMSCALGQRLDPATRPVSRLVIGFDLTDELFGAAISLGEKVKAPFYFGMMTVSMSGWALGTLFGAILGEVLPEIFVTALGLGLYGMFIAIVVPAAKRNRVLFGAVTFSMAASLLLSLLPVTKDWSSGVRTIVLTIVIASALALLFPVKDDEEEAVK